MNIKTVSKLEATYLATLNSIKNQTDTSGEVSFADTLDCAKEMLERAELSSADKNALCAMTVDAAVDAIQQSGGYGLSLDSELASTLNLHIPVVSSTSSDSGTPIEFETSEEAAARIATQTFSPATVDAYDASKASSNYGGILNCSDEMNGYFDEAAATYGVDVKLLKSFAMTESGFNPSATSNSGAMGVMQLMPYTAEELGVEHPYDAYESIMGGAKLISQLLTKYNGNISLAAAAYNAGSNAVDEYNGIPPYEETQNYVKKILQYYQG